MRSLSRRLTLGACAAVTTGVTWALASGVVTIFPATLTSTVSLPSETLVSVTAVAYPPSGSQISRSVAVSGGTAPVSVDLTVDGGDGSDPSNPGVAYIPALYAYVNNPTATNGNSYLYMYRSTATTVQNTSPSIPASVGLTYSYPTSYRANTTVTVNGGTLTGLQLYASASNNAINESYYGYSYASPTTASAAITTWLPMVPNASVSITGTAYVTSSSGTVSQRSLPYQTINLSTGSANVSWAIDLTNTGSLQGAFALGAAPTSTATPTTYYVYYQGTSTTSSGVYGNVQTTASTPSYAVSLTPGDYDVFLRTYFSTPFQFSDTGHATVHVTAGATTVHDFTDSLAVVRAGLSVAGFYAKENLSSSYNYVRSPDYSSIAGTYELTGGNYVHTVPAGTWQPYLTSLSLYDQSNPALPLNNQIQRYYYTDTDFTSATLGAGGDTTLGTAAFTLVKSNLYFDVTEPAGQPQVNVSSPQVTATRLEYNADSSLKTQTYVYAYGSGTAQPVSGLTMVAEPGDYTLDARAYVNGTLTHFAGATMTFGEPIPTPPGTNVSVTLTPAQNADLRIDLTFPQVSAPSSGTGLSTVVETPIGPAPPQGLRAFCDDNPANNPEGVTCTTVYYDISTTAAFTGPVKVCVRRLSIDSNAAASFLTLYHYNASLSPSAWEALPAPPGMASPAIDCGSGNPADLAACHCADEASCGIDLANGLDTFLVCGMTTSFSPFAVFQGTVQLSNVVGGTAYSGPTGPAQTWTVPGDGTYKITATGAQGGAATAGTMVGGCGAEITGSFALHKGDVLNVLVGQKGTAATNNAGGGGGTFVTRNGAPLVIAGGGGGVRSTATVNGRNGTIASTGTAGSTTAGYTGSFVPGGAGGAGGSRIPGYGNGGGGWSGSGASDGTYGEGGYAFTGAGHASGGNAKACGVFAHGGFGGGGAGNGCYGAGGGGGYSGGGGGRIGGGGGSLNNGTSPSGREGICTPSGHGLVTIDLVGP